MQNIDFENGNMLDEVYSIVNDGLIYEKLNPIADKYNLNLDQLGQLNSDLELFLYGKIKSDTLIKTISDNLEISTEITNNIWKDIDEQIISEVRKQLRSKFEKAGEINDRETEIEAQPPENVVPPSPIPTPPTPTPPTPITLEQAGQFTIEPKPVPSTSNLYRDNGLNREDILKSIEDAQIPKPAEPVQESKVNLVDHLLTTPKVNVQKVEQKQVVVDKKPDQAPKSYAADPYREQI